MGSTQMKTVLNRQWAPGKEDSTRGIDSAGGLKENPRNAALKRRAPRDSVVRMTEWL